MIENMENIIDKVEQFKNIKQKVNVTKEFAEGVNFAILLTLVEILDELKGKTDYDSMTKKELAELIDKENIEELMKLKKEELIEKLK